MLITLCIPFWGTSALLHYQKKQVKKAVKWRMIEGIPQEKLVCLTLTENEKNTQLTWKHAKEFEYKQQMYDIVSTQIINDTTYYWCWWDHEETALNQQLKSLVQNIWKNKKQTNPTEDHFLSYLKSLYFKYHSEHKELFTQIAQVKFTYIKAHKNHIHELNTPPPKV